MHLGEKIFEALSETSSFRRFLQSNPDFPFKLVHKIDVQGKCEHARPWFKSDTARDQSLEHGKLPQPATKERG